MKKIWSLVLALILCANFNAPVIAAEEVTEPPPEGEQISSEVDTGLVPDPAEDLVTNPGPDSEGEPATESGPAEATPEAPPEPPQGEEIPTIIYEDVPEGHNFYTAIMDCAAKGITSGYSDGTFRPTNSVTKAQFAVMLSRAFYAGEVEKYNTKVYTDQGWFVPNTRALYMTGVLKGTSFVSYSATNDVMDQTINRYDMAQLITNIMANKGFTATEAQKTEAQEEIADYNSIPTQYQDAVKNVFALGIITGYSNGTFGGLNIMNRGQGCVVIYRMTQYTPAASPSGTNDMTSGGGKVETPATPVPATPKPETQMPSQPETPAVKTLSNGEAVTEANVLALLNELKAKYPEGTSFAFGYNSPSKYVNAAVNRYTGKTGTTGRCGGWAALVSDYIFGKTDFPAHQVSLNAARPGDIGLCLDTNGKVTHIFIVTAHVQRRDGGEWTEIPCTDANHNASQGGDNLIYWTASQGQWDDGYTGTIDIWTRYPD